MVADGDADRDGLVDAGLDGDPDVDAREDAGADGDGAAVDLDLASAAEIAASIWATVTVLFSEPTRLPVHEHRRRPVDALLGRCVGHPGHQVLVLVRRHAGREVGARDAGLLAPVDQLSSPACPCSPRPAGCSSRSSCPYTMSWNFRNASGLWSEAQ